MTYQIYSQQHLQHKSIARLKQIYSEIACTIEVTDKRCKDSWITAIADYQASKIHKIVDEQTTAQTELNGFITAQAQDIAPEPLTTVEITFYDHEIYAGDKLIASIAHDDNDFVTQRWVVTANGAEEHRADTWAKCHRYIQWHHQDGTLPVQEQLSEANDTTGNEIMVQVFNECEKYSFDIFDDGIYNNDVKLGEVGFSRGTWWVVGAAEQKRVACQSALEAVWWLAVAQTPLYAETASCEELLDRPFDELTTEEWRRLREYAPSTQSCELVAA